MLAHLKSNKKGVVFITVLAIIIVTMVLTVSMVSMNITQVTIAEDEIRRVQAQTLSLGTVGYVFMDQLSGAPAGVSGTEIMDGHTFTVTTNITVDGSGPFGTSPMNIVVDY